MAGSGLKMALISHKVMVKMKKPKCPVHKRTEMDFCGFGDMGSSHGNWYKCPKCGKKIHIYDRDLD